MSFYEELLIKKPESTLYHYTNQEGLLGIINNKSIWLTNIHYLNDEKEFKYAFDILLGRLSIHINDSQADLKNYYIKLQKKLKDVSNMAIYIFSLSEEGNQLSQWRSYCSEGNAFSLGFNYEKLESFIRPSLYIIIPCLYEDGQQTKLIDEELEEFIINEDELKTYTTEKIIQRSETFAIKFGLLAAFIKHPSFKEEKEWRVVSNPIDYNHNNIGYRVGKNSIIPFFNLELSQDDKNFPIDEIIVGPTSQKDLSIRSTENLLLTNGFTERIVSYSNIPFREL